jgi:hypothetical protein
MQLTSHFDHFLLTRFNIRHETRAPEAWLRHRIGYFERVCLPSVRIQTVPFTWLVYFDAERDAWFEDEVSRLSQGDVFEPIWVTGTPTPEEFLEPVLRRAESPFLITSRIDNDDAMAKTLMARVQDQFSGQEREFINFTDGMQLSDDGRLFHRSDPSNAFISLIEKREAAMGVYVDWHNRVSKHAPVRQISGPPMWLQAVHGLNIGNTARGVRADPALLTQHFDVTAVAAPISKPRLLVAQVTSAAKLGLRVVRKPSRILWLAQVIRARSRRG